MLKLSKAETESVGATAMSPLELTDVEAMDLAENATTSKDEDAKESASESK